MIPEELELAQRLYTEYSKSTGGKAYNGDPLPTAQELWADPTKARIQKAWEDAAAAALEFSRQGWNPVGSCTPDELFVEAFAAMQNRVHATALAKGWWDEHEAVKYLRNNCENLPPHVREDIELGMERTPAECIALIHSELSEALEALRHGNPPDDKIPQFSGAEAELADVVIRIMDLAGRRGWRIPEAIVAKAAFNRGRPRKHGKEF